MRLIGELMGTNISEISFKFNKDNLMVAKLLLKQYPNNFSERATLPFLHLAQEKLNWSLTKSSIEYVYNFLKICNRVIH